MVNSITQNPEDRQHIGMAQPVCHRCFAPFYPHQDYCDNCGEAVGKLTPYKPFVNIRFNYSIFGRMWHIVWRDSNASFILKAFCLFLIMLFAPIMLIVGIPFVLREKWRQKGSLNSSG